MPRTRRVKRPVFLYLAIAIGAAGSIAVLWCLSRAEDWWFQPESVAIAAEPRPFDPQLLDLSRRAVVALERWQR